MNDDFHPFIAARYHSRSFENRQFVEKALLATARWTLSDNAFRFLNHLLGASGKSQLPYLSNSQLRTESSQILAKHMAMFWTEQVPSSRQRYFFTFSCNAGFTSDRTPTIRLRTIARMTQRAIRRMGLSAICQVEIQAIINYPQQGHGRTLMVHVHAVAWGDVSANEVAEAVEQLNASRAWRNSLGEPIVYRNIGNDEELIQLTFYIDKLPKSGKNRIERRDAPGRYRLMETMAGYRPELCLRLLEGLSLIPIVDAVFSVNDGNIIRRRWKHELGEWRRKQPVDPFGTTKAAIARFWSEVRQNNGSKRFQSYVIE